MPVKTKLGTPHRRHVTTACIHCRQNKLKCDGKQPSCDNCIHKGQKCEYQIGKDKRQFSLRKVTEVYSRRVLQLEQCIQSLGGQVPPPLTDHDSSLLSQVAETVPRPAVPQEIYPRPERSETASNVLSATTSWDPHLGNDPVYNIGLDFVPSMNVLDRNDQNLNTTLVKTPDSKHSYEPYDFMMSDGQFQVDSDVDPTNWMWPLADPIPFPTAQPFDVVPDMQVFPNRSPPANFPMPLIQEVPVPRTNETSEEHHGEYSASSSEDERVDEIIEQLSNRLGCLQMGDTGELKYYGPTSNLTLTSNGLSRKHRESVTTRPKEAQTNLEQAAVGHHVDASLVDHLLDLYFTWQDPSSHVVDKTIFQEERAQYQATDRESSLYSASLENAMCALGAMFDNKRHTGLPRPLSQFFNKRAQILVEFEIDSPKITTVQTYALLASYQGASTKDSRGWLYTGVAARIALDLGLHIDPTPRVEDGSMDIRTARARSVAFWGSYVMDHMWGFYLGRTFNIFTGEITLPLPGAFDFDAANHVWTPSGMFTQQTGHDDSPVYDCSREKLQSQWVTLCQTVSTLTTILYGRMQISRDELVDLGILTLHRLREWRSNLPPELQYSRVDKSRKVTPHVLLLHMQYYCFIIIHHRPWLSKSQGGIQPQPPHGEGPAHARRMCLESAIEIARLLDDYADRFPLRLAQTQIVYIAFSAALILVYAAVSESDRQRHANLAGHLATCSNALAELGEIFENATRSLDTLLIIKRAWQARLVASTGHKRRSTREAPTDAPNTYKKSREGSSDFASRDAGMPIYT